MRYVGSSLLICALLIAACEGDRGKPGEPGAPGTAAENCTLTDNGDGTATVACPNGTTVTIPTGGDTDGGMTDTTCTVTDNGDGTATVSCPGGTDVTVPIVTPATDAGVPPVMPTVGPEQCATCHTNHGWKNHQEIYNKYNDSSALKLSYVSTTVSGSGPYTVTVTVDITKNGLPFVDINGLPMLNQKRFYIVSYDNASRTFGGTAGADVISLSNPAVVSGTPGRYTVSSTTATFDPTATAFNGMFYGYIADDVLDTESGGHVTMYDNVASAGHVYGTTPPNATNYVSSANAAGCEKCHGAPYMKHGYRAAAVENLGDFAACKVCHVDDRDGGHLDWQILVEDPARLVELNGLAAANNNDIEDHMTTDELARYAYKRTVMADTHMSHAMEFPYPQSMATCTTCHEGKMNQVATDANFKLETCLSCHPVTGSEDYGTSDYALETIWANANVLTLHQNYDRSTNCTTGCHTSGGNAVTFAELHNGGYDPMIYTTGGAARWADLFKGKIDSATWDATTHKLTVTISAEEVGGASANATYDADDITPTLLVGPYGWDTKDFIVAPHGRDDDRNRLLEFTLGDTNPRFNVTNDGGDTWTIEVDMSMWAQMFTDGIIKRVEIGMMPALVDIVGNADEDDGSCTDACARGTHCESSACVPNDDVILALDAPSRTFDLGTNAFDDTFYKDITDVAKCNACHDALGTSFHSGNRGGNVRVCRLCHVHSSGGSHLEMQSRSIDSYVHAIHSFQAFDPGDIDFTDDVEATRYALHVEHVFPNFSIKNCEACHNPGTYNNPPDQSKSLPGILSGSDDVDGRNIGKVPSYVTGPGARACGACHRSHKINEDDFAGLVSFFQHIKANGYLVENDDGVLDSVITQIMAWFY